MCRKDWWSNTSEKAVSSGCLRTGARPIPAIISSIRAANPPRPSRWWSMPCAIAVQRPPPADERTYSRNSGFVSWLFIKSTALGEDVRLVDFLHPVRRLDFLHGNRHRLFAVMERRHHRFGDLGSEFLFLLLGFARPQLHDDMGHGRTPFICWTSRRRRSCNPVICS